MLDLKFIRENKDAACAALAGKRVSSEVIDEVIALDEKRRSLLFEIDDLKAKKNQANDAITHSLKEKRDPSMMIQSMKGVASQIAEMEPKLKEIEGRITDILLRLPNFPHSSVPKGGADQNQVVRTWGQPRGFNFTPKNHVELAESLDIVDFKRGAKLTGSNFILYKNAGARLERALINFMLDLHTGKHGYSEMFPPFLVNRASMTGTGQLPKMEEDMYRLKDEDLFLIPTAEVPVTNIYRDEVLEESQLPLYHTAYSACFRREAGSYGKDTRGLMRVHQFNKVELVKFVHPSQSYAELEKLVANAETVFQLFNLPYRVLELASGDLSFAAAKCYDLEVFAPGLDKWLEASSCSNFEDFQARRANIRFKCSQTKKQQFVHTLNGSGVAMPRTMVAIIENYQTPEGNIVVPEVLRPYMGGIELITK